MGLWIEDVDCFKMKKKKKKKKKETISNADGTGPMPYYYSPYSQLYACSDVDYSNSG